MVPADLAERLHVFVTEAVGLGRRASPRVLLSPLALWEHTVQTSTHTQPFHRQRCSTPVLLQGGEVGQQALVVELLQLQEVDGPAVWRGWQLKTTVRDSQVLLKDAHTHTHPTSLRGGGAMAVVRATAETQQEGSIPP